MVCMMSALSNGAELPKSFGAGSGEGRGEEVDLMKMHITGLHLCAKRAKG